MQEISLGIEADDLAPRPESGIDGHDPFLSDRRCKKKLAVERQEQNPVNIIIRKAKHRQALAAEIVDSEGNVIWTPAVEVEVVNEEAVAEASFYS